MLDLETPRGSVIAIGRFKVPKMPVHGFDCDIPDFSFIVIKRGADENSSFKWDGGAFIATCIQMQMDGYGATISEACNDMSDKVRDYIYENFKNPEHREDAWENLFELLRPNEHTNMLWDKYHALPEEHLKSVY